jgi:hypothetical protein
VKLRRHHPDDPRGVPARSCGQADDVSVLPEPVRFEGVYWARTNEWDPVRAAFAGAPLCDLPAVLRWFSGNIGYHSIHHIEYGNPSYNPRACHQGVPELQGKAALRRRAQRYRQPALFEDLLHTAEVTTARRRAPGELSGSRGRSRAASRRRGRQPSATARREHIAGNTSTTTAEGLAECPARWSG